MKDGRLLLVGFIITLFLGLSCSPRQVSGPAPEALVPAMEKTSAPGLTGWEAEWDKALKAAQKEGKVVVYAATPGPALKEATSEFRKKFGFALEVLTGPPGDIRNKIVAERNNGLYLQDVFITGMNSHYMVTVPRNWGIPMEPEFILPDVKDPKNWFGGKIPYEDERKTILSFLAYPTMNLAINTELVKEGEISSFRDLLDPRWKDKVIINDPQVTGTAFNGFSSFLEHKILDVDYYRQLVKQGPVIRDSTTQVDWVARGKYAVIIWPDTNEIRRYQQAGAPIAWVFPNEGAYMSTDGSGTVLLDKLPHPNAARIFLNWLLGKEGQKHIQKEMTYHSARVDVGTEGLDPLNTRREGVKYIPSANSNREWLLNEQPKFEVLAKEIFGAAK